MMVLVSIAVGTGYLFSIAATFILTEVVDIYWEISTLVVFLLWSLDGDANDPQSHRSTARIG